MKWWRYSGRRGGFGMLMLIVMLRVVVAMVVQVGFRSKWTVLPACFLWLCVHQQSIQQTHTNPYTNSSNPISSSPSSARPYLHQPHPHSHSHLNHSNYPHPRLHPRNPATGTTQYPPPHPTAPTISDCSYLVLLPLRIGYRQKPPSRG